MTLDEFVKLDPKKIRRDKELMQLFVDFYKAAFSLQPNCVGCVFNSGFNKLKRYAKKGNFTENKTIMQSKTFILKPKQAVKIHRYKESGKMYRTYGYAMDEAFARKLVEHGKTDIFAKLPDNVKLQSKAKVVDNKNIPTLTSKPKDYASMDWKDEILPLYASVREKTGKKANSRSKDDIIAFLKENEG